MRQTHLRGKGLFLRLALTEAFKDLPAIPIFFFVFFFFFLIFWVISSPAGHQSPSPVQSDWIIPSSGPHQ